MQKKMQALSLLNVPVVFFYFSKLNNCLSVVVAVVLARDKPHFGVPGVRFFVCVFVHFFVVRLIFFLKKIKNSTKNKKKLTSRGA